jgi:hypothetical protein
VTAGDGGTSGAKGCAVTQLGSEVIATRLGVSVSGILFFWTGGATVTLMPLVVGRHLLIPGVARRRARPEGGDYGATDDAPTESWRDLLREPVVTAAVPSSVAEVARGAGARAQDWSGPRPPRAAVRSMEELDEQLILDNISSKFNVRASDWR